MEPWFSQMKSDRVGELPEAAKESCEDITPPGERCPRKLKFGRRLRWVLPLRPYPLFRRLAPWRSTRSVAGRLKSPSLLIQSQGYRSSNLVQMVPKYCEEMCLGSRVERFERRVIPGTEIGASSPELRSRPTRLIPGLVRLWESVEKSQVSHVVYLVPCIAFNHR